MLVGHRLIFGCFVVFSFHALFPLSALPPPKAVIKHYRNLARGLITYPGGYDETKHALNIHLGAAKHSSSTTEGLQALAALELQIYERIKDVNSTWAPTVARQAPKEQLQSSSIMAFVGDIQEYLESFEATSLRLIRQECSNASVYGRNEGKVSTEIVAGNPIAAFKMIQRFRYYIQKWSKLSGENCSLPQELYLRRYLEREYEEEGGPTLADYQISMTAIIMLQHRLDLRSKDVADGRLQGTMTGVSLNVNDCTEIGLHAIALKKYAIGVEWLEVAQAQTRENNDAAELLLASELLQLAMETHDRKWIKAKESTRENFFLHPLTDQAVPSEERRWWKQELLGAIGPINSTDYDPSRRGMDYSQNLLFWSVCKGDRRQAESEKANLFCWYESEVHSFWKIGPLKAELFSRLPQTEVVQFYDLLSSEDIRRVQNVRLLNYSGIQKHHYDPTEDHSTFDALLPAHSTMFKKLSDLFSRVTGLRFGSGSKIPLIRVSDYPPGGFLRPHSDECIDNRGTFIAGFIAYLDEPEQGGETAFAYSKAIVKPVKGSVSFWYNLRDSGFCDRYSFHGSCQVVLGSKSILTFWPEYNDQTHLKCSMDPELPLEVLVNGKSKYSQSRAHHRLISAK